MDEGGLCGLRVLESIPGCLPALRDKGNGVKQKVVGVFECGYEQIQLVLREGTGGEFCSCPEKGGLPRIKVGAMSPGKWRQVVAVLMHEIVEFAMWRQDCRYSPDNRIAPISHADYLFVMTHEKFNDCITKVAEFIHAALPPLAKSYNAWHKGKGGAK